MNISRRTAFCLVAVISVALMGLVYNLSKTNTPEHSEIELMIDSIDEHVNDTIFPMVLYSRTYFSKSNGDKETDGGEVVFNFHMLTDDLTLIYSEEETHQFTQKFAKYFISYAYNYDKYLADIFDNCIDKYRIAFYISAPKSKHPAIYEIDKTDLKNIIQEVKNEKFYNLYFDLYIYATSPTKGFVYNFNGIPCVTSHIGFDGKTFTQETKFLDNENVSLDFGNEDCVVNVASVIKNERHKKFSSNALWICYDNDLNIEQRFATQYDKQQKRVLITRKMIDQYL